MIQDLRFTRAPRSLRRAGLLGWLAFRIGADWRIDSVAVRRTRAGLIRLSFPSRVDGAGREHPFVLPACGRVWRELERAVLAELGPEAVP